MTTTPYHGFRFPKAIIQHTIWLYYLSFTTTPYHGFQFPKAIIQHAMWPYYLSFTLSLRYGYEDQRRLGSRRP